MVTREEAYILFYEGLRGINQRAKNKDRKPSCVQASRCCFSTSFLKGLLESKKNKLRMEQNTSVIEGAREIEMHSHICRRERERES